MIEICDQVLSRHDAGIHMMKSTVTDLVPLLEKLFPYPRAGRFINQNGIPESVHGAGVNCPPDILFVRTVRNYLIPAD